MTKRRKWTAIPGLILLAVGAVVLSAYSGASSSQNNSPKQPIAFPHPTHVQKLGMNCVYCHNAANKSMDPGLPAVSTCVGCHSMVGPDRPAAPVIEKYSGVLAAADVFTESTTFQVLQSLRLDLGYGSWVHP